MGKCRQGYEAVRVYGWVGSGLKYFKYTEECRSTLEGTIFKNSELLGYTLKQCQSLGTFHIGYGTENKHAWGRAKLTLLTFYHPTVPACAPQFFKKYYGVYT